MTTNRHLGIHLDMLGAGRYSQLDLHDNTSRNLLAPWATRVDFSLVKNTTGQVIETVSLDALAWNQFREFVVMRTLLSDAASAGLMSALRAQIDLVQNFYEHDPCNTEWTDTHSCACNDRCPCCRAEIDPQNTAVFREIFEVAPGSFSLREGEDLVDENVLRERVSG